MPRDTAKAQRLRERKERKQLEAQIKQSDERCTEALSFLEPEGGKAPSYAKATALLDQAIELHSSSARAYNLRARAFLEQGKLEGAIEDFTNASTIDPVDTTALEGRARCRMRLGMWDEAISDYSAVIHHTPTNDHAWNMRGVARIRKRVERLVLPQAEFAAAVGDYLEALRHNECNFTAHVNLGKAYEDQRMPEKAIEHFGLALRLKDDYTYARYRRGCARLRWADETAAAAATRRAAPPPDGAGVEAIVAHEVALEEAERQTVELRQAAIEDLRRCVGDGDDPERDEAALTFIGACYGGLGDLNGAKEAYAAALKVHHAAAAAAAAAAEGSAVATPPRASHAVVLIEARLRDIDAQLAQRREAVLNAM